LTRAAFFASHLPDIHVQTRSNGNGDEWTASRSATCWPPPGPLISAHWPAGFPDFSWHNIPKWVKICQIPLN
jgi:hypothetical protein